jgi:hypothetical protein
MYNSPTYGQVQNNGTGFNISFADTTSGYCPIVIVRKGKAERNWNRSGRVRSYGVCSDLEHYCTQPGYWSHLLVKCYLRFEHLWCSRPQLSSVIHHLTLFNNWYV